jgi:integrase
MVKLYQDNKGNYSARKRLPDDVRDDYGRLYGARHEAKFSAPASVGKRIANEKFNEWEADVERRAVKTVFKWGAKRKLTNNPFLDATVDVPRRKQLRPKSFYEHERTAILSAASAITVSTNPDMAACRWVPWLLAYTGARPGEITQLRGSDVQFIEGMWTLDLTPEAGTIKGGIARRVPLHEHLVEQGFLEFVRTRGDGPLFYRPRVNKRTTADQSRQKKAPAAQARQRLASWVREVGVDDEHLSPNHAWRHTFKLIDRSVEPDGTLLDYICGHAPATEGRGYGAPSLSDMAQVIEKFPRYDLGSNKGPSSDHG